MPIQEGFHTCKTPKGRECWVSFSDEGNLLEISLPIIISDDPVTIDIMAGQERRWSSQGTVLPHFFVLENSRMIQDRETGEIEPLSVYCTDQEKAKEILKNPGLFKAILSFIAQHGAMSVVITDDEVAASWTNFKPSKEKDESFLSSVLSLFDRIADDFPEGILPATETQPPARSDWKILGSTLRFLWRKPDAYIVLYFLLILAIVSPLASIWLHTLGVFGWILKKFYIPSFLLCLLYYYAIHVRYFSIWNSSRLLPGQSNPQGLFRHFTGLVFSLFFGFAGVFITTFPTALANRMVGPQTLISDGATIISKDKGSDDSFPSVTVKNFQGLTWQITIPRGELEYYSEGDAFAVTLYRGYLGLYYYRR